MRCCPFFPFPNCQSTLACSVQLPSSSSSLFVSVVVDCVSLSLSHSLLCVPPSLPPDDLGLEIPSFFCSSSPPPPPSFNLLRFLFSPSLSSSSVTYFLSFLLSPFPLFHFSPFVFPPPTSHLFLLPFPLTYFSPSTNPICFLPSLFLLHDLLALIVNVAPTQTLSSHSLLHTTIKRPPTLPLPLPRIH